MTRLCYKGLILMLALLLLGPAACLRMKYPMAGRPVAAAEGEALVFGRIAVIDRDHEIEPWRSGLTEALFAGEKPEIKLSLFLVEENRRAVYVRIEPDGNFYWILPAGTYLLYHSQADRQPPNEPLSAFQAPPGAHAVYIGTMTMHIESSENRATGKQDYELSAIRIADEQEQAKQVLAARFPDLSGPVARMLMITDPSLRGLFRDYSKRACEKILERHGLRLLGPDVMRKN